MNEELPLPTLAAAATKSAETASRTSRYGWVMVGVAFLLLAVGAGNQYMTALLLEPLQDMMKASLAAVSLATLSAMTAVVAVASPLCGMMVQRYSLRIFIAIAFGAVAISYVGLAYATELWQVSLIYALGFAAGVTISQLAGATLVSNWFVRQRGLALGIANAGTSAAGCVIPPIATYAIHHLGLRDTCLIGALIILAPLPLMWRLVVDKPEAKALCPDGIRGSPSDEECGLTERPGAALSEIPWTMKSLLFSTEFWIITAVASTPAAIGSVLEMDLMQIALDNSIDKLDAAYLISYALGSTIISTVIFGKVFDHVKLQLMARITIAISMLPCLLLLGEPNYNTMICASVFVGCGLGAALLMPNLLIAEYFGRGAFPLALGAMSPFIMGIFATGLPLFGLAYDLTGNYDLGLGFFFLALSLTAGVTHFINK